MTIESFNASQYAHLNAVEVFGIIFDSDVINLIMTESRNYTTQKKPTFICN